MDHHIQNTQGFGYCHLAVAPLRADHDHRSEMTSQLLFGETLIIKDKFRTWRRIRCAHDGYEAWIDAKQFTEISEDEFIRLSHLPAASSFELIQLIADLTSNRLFPVLIGSSLAGLRDEKINIGQTIYQFEGTPLYPPARIQPSNILDVASLYLNCPYQWGGRSPFGIDCSGFVQMVFKMNGISLFRDASEQATQGDVVNLPIEIRPGDVAFFDNDDGEIVHTGILTDQGTIIHASGCVRIDQIDHFGIFDRITRRYTHKIRVIKRII